MRNIILTTYDTAFFHHGGGEREMFLLCDALNASNMQAEMYGPNSKPIDSYDAAIHFSLTPESSHFVATLRENVSALYLWQNVWFVEEPSESYINNISEQLRKFDYIIFKSDAEENNFLQYFTVPENKIIRVVTGGDLSFGIQEDSDIFRDVHNLDEYLFWPGIIEPQKNQLTAINALKNLDIPIVFAGDIRDRGYYDLCKSVAPKSYLFLNEMPPASQLLRSAMCYCKLYIEIPTDFPGISAFEAALSGCHMVLNDCEWSRSHFSDDAVYVNPFSEDEILSTVTNALLCDYDDPINTKKYRQYLSPNAYNELVVSLNSSLV